VPAHEDVTQTDETLTFLGLDPVAHWERVLEVVVAPTGEAARFHAATNGDGSAWITRAEPRLVMGFLQDWLDRTEEF